MTKNRHLIAQPLMPGPAEDGEAMEAGAQPAEDAGEAGRDPSGNPLAGHLSQIDSLNREIILRLMDDGRASFSEIARALGVAEGTVRSRVAHMRRENFLRFVAVVNPLALGYSAWAMIGVNLAPGVDPNSVAEYFRDRTETIYVMRVAGRYNLLVEVICKNPDELRRFLDAHFHSWDAIASVEPLVGLGMYKSLLKWEGLPPGVPGGSPAAPRGDADG